MTKEDFYRCCMKSKEIEEAKEVDVVADVRVNCGK